MMVTGREEIVAAVIRQERLREAQQHRLVRRISRPRSNFLTATAAFLSRVRERSAKSRSLEATTPRRQQAAER